MHDRLITSGHGHGGCSVVLAGAVTNLTIQDRPALEHAPGKLTWCRVLIVPGQPLDAAAAAAATAALLASWADEAAAEAAAEDAPASSHSIS